MKILLFALLTMLMVNSTFAQTQDNITGTWVCSEYAKYNIPYKESRYINEIEEYAKEFKKYVYFTITKEPDSTYTVVANDQYKTPLFNFEEITKDTLSKNNEVRWCSHILNNCKLDSGLFLNPKYNYQYFRMGKLEEVPSYDNNPFGMPMLYSDNSIIIPYNGYLFTFNKGIKSQSVYEIKGIPGVRDTYFKVEYVYRNNTIERVYPKFLVDFPYCASKMPKELPLKNHELKDPTGITKIFWIHKRYLKLELNELGEYFIIEFEQIGNDVRLLYRFKAFDEDLGPDYQG